MVGELKLHSAGTEVADTRTRVNNETWRRERCQYLEAAGGGGGALVKRDDAVLRGGDEVVEIRRLQRWREPARRHRGAGGPTTGSRSLRG